MTAESDNILLYGNLVIGIGTFSLAIVLALVNWKNSVLDRAVHIADKQKDWMTEFRNLISELLAVQNKILKGVDVSSMTDMDRLLQQLATIQYKIRFMFPEGNHMVERLIILSV